MRNTFVGNLYQEQCSCSGRHEAAAGDLPDLCSVWYDGYHSGFSAGAGTFGRTYAGIFGGSLWIAANMDFYIF